MPLGEERQWCYPERPASCRGRGHDDKEACDEGDCRGPEGAGAEPRRSPQGGQSAVVSPFAGPVIWGPPSPKWVRYQRLSHLY